MPKREVIVTYKKQLGIPEDKISEYKEAFDMFDENRDGLISADEISKIMKNFGNPVSKKEVREMIKGCDTSGDGLLDFEEFVTFMQKQIEVKEINDDDIVLNAFKSFDKNHDGKITNYEFKYILTKLGAAFTDDEINTLFKACNLDPQGELEYEPFINYWRSKSK